MTHFVKIGQRNLNRFIFKNPVHFGVEKDVIVANPHCLQVFQRRVLATPALERFPRHETLKLKAKIRQIFGVRFVFGDDDCFGSWQIGRVLGTIRQVVQGQETKDRAAKTKIYRFE